MTWFISRSTALRTASIPSTYTNRELFDIEKNTVYIQYILYMYIYRSCDFVQNIKIINSRPGVLYKIRYQMATSFVVLMLNYYSIKNILTENISQISFEVVLTGSTS